jgi:hypothetical protein
MLKQAKPEEIEKLRAKDGQEYDMINITALRPGKIIKVETYSGNTYLYELIDPGQALAHVFRCKTREDNAENAGYRGKKTVNPTFQIGKRIFHKEGDEQSNTSPVKRIVIF